MQKQVVGTCQIIGKTAGSTQGHYYHLESLALPAFLDGLKRGVDVLTPVHRDATMTEVGGLFLDPSVRQQGLSALTSFARLLFIGIHPHRFCRQVIAEIRGVVDENRISPFWNGVGRHFLDLDFQELMQRVAADPSLIPALVSPIPIYRFLLNPTIQAILGKAHHLSQIALARLLDQGFHYTGDIDPFDAGPKVMAETSEIQVVRQHQHVVISRVHAAAEERNRCLIANDAFSEFRACTTSATFVDDGSIEIDEATAQALHVAVNEKVRVFTLKARQGPHP